MFASRGLASVKGDNLASNRSYLKGSNSGLIGPVAGWEIDRACEFIVPNVTWDKTWSTGLDHHMTARFI